MSIGWQIAVGLLALASVFSIVIGALRTKISPMPSSRKATKRLLSLVPPGEGPVVELGAGWGGLCIALARAHPQRQVIGYELSSIPWLCSLLRARLAGMENLSVYKLDFFVTDLSAAQVVVCYLYPVGMSRLSPKLLAELEPGATVLSNTFALPGWEPEAVEKLDDLHRTPVYRYRMGEGPT